MKTTSLARLALLCSSFFSAGVFTAQAQTTTTTTANTKSTLQEVVVTASRRSVNLQKTSIAVTAISGTTIQQQGETNLQQIIQDVPGVTITSQQRGFTATIRGQGTDLPPGSGQGAVATEFDGVYNIRAEGGVVGYYDLARVEVLPGPQGTLYGVNSDGGVVNVISNDPVIGKFSGGGSVNIGNYHLYRGEAEVNVPLGDVLALRLAGAAINRTAYITPAQGDAVGQSGRAKLLYKPNDQLSLLAGFEMYHIGGLGTGASVSYYQNGDINNLKNPWGQGAYVSSGPSTANSHESEYGKKYWVNASYDLGDVAVLNITPSYSRDRDKDQLCGPAGPPGTSDVPGSCDTNRDPTLLEQVSSEERITNAPGSKLLWDFGAYHWNYREKSSGGGGSYVGQQSNAGFAEFTYPILPTLRLIGGVRESFDHKTSWETYQSYTDTQYGANFSHFDYRVGLEYDAAPQSMEYFTVSTGYRPGGINSAVSSTATPTLFKTEEVTSFELGSKNRFLDNSLQLNGDVFYYNQHNYQLLDFYTPYVYNATATDTNACDVAPGAAEPASCVGPTLNLNAYVIGAEFQARYNLTPDDQFNASGSYLDAKFSNNQPGPCVSTAAGAPAGGCYAGGNVISDTLVNNYGPTSVFYENLKGLTQPHAPTFSGNFSYQHTIDLASGASLSAAVQIYVSTGYWVHPIESPYSYQPSYWTQGLNTTYSAPAGNWSLNAYVRNLSNYAVKTSLNPQEIGEPRTFGVTGTWHF